MRRLLLAAALALTPLTAVAQDAPPAPPSPPAPDAPGAPGSPSDAGSGARPGRPAMTPEMRSAFQAMRTACAADMARLCGDAQASASSGGQPGAQPSRGGAMRCMIQHSTEISPGCEQAIGAMRALRHADHG